MFLLIAGFTMPLLLVFGLYHLLTWFNVLTMNDRAFRQRLGIVSAASHIILVTGFFIFSYFDYRMNQNTTLIGLGFDGYLFNRSEFWRLMVIFDTAPMLALLGILAILDKLGLNPPFMVALSIAVTLIVGTLQWYLVGGGVGLLLERFWTGLKTSQDAEEDWF